MVFFGFWYFCDKAQQSILGGIGMRKIIMFFTFIISLATIILFILSIEQLFEAFSLGFFDFDEIIAMIEEMPFEELTPILSMILWNVFQIFGIPLLVFLVSLHGLTSK
jgi:hypothetical protein